MSLVMDHEPALRGYEAVPLLLAGEQAAGQGSATVLRRRGSRPARRATLYVHGPGDDFAGDDIAEWYVCRGFHFYAADLREAGNARPGTRPARRAPAARRPGEAVPARRRGEAVPARRPGEPAPAAPHPGPAAGGGTEDRQGAAGPGRSGSGAAPRHGTRSGAAPRDGRAATEDLGRCFARLDAAAAHLRQAGEIRTVVVCAHGTGALIAALWCHVRRASSPADALVLASPQLGPGGAPLRTWAAAARPGHPAWRPPPLVASAQRRVRRGLNVSCPVLVMCPAGDPETPAASGQLLSQLVAGWRLTVRLGQHVTWLQLEGRLPGHGVMAAADRKRFFDQLSRWLGAYLSAQLRDQLL